MTAQEVQLRRVGIIGTLMVLLVGGVVLAIALLPSFSDRSGAAPLTQQNAVRPMPREAAESHALARPTPPPLPTIAAQAAALVPSSGDADTHPSLTTSPAANLQDAAPLAAQVSLPSGNDLAARLAAHLTCIQTKAQHDPALDARAATFAHEEAGPLPAQGAIHIAKPDGERFLLGPDMVAELSLPHARCGETLLFGVPPLLWLPAGTHFGIALDQRSDGLVVVIVTQ